MRISALCFPGAIFVLLSFAFNPDKTSQNGNYTQVDSCTYVKFNGKPERCFYQTPLGDVTNLEYRPASDAVDSNLLYSATLYKESMASTLTSEQLQTAINLKLNTLVSSEEMMINNLKGKILFKKDLVVDNCQVLKYKILFTNLSEMDQIEGQKDVIYNTEFLKCKDHILKLSTYTQTNKENIMIDVFFNSLQIKK